MRYTVIQLRYSYFLWPFDFKFSIERLNNSRNSGDITFCGCFRLPLVEESFKSLVPLEFCILPRGCLSVSVEDDVPTLREFAVEEEFCNGEVVLPTLRCRNEGAGKFLRLSIVSTKR